jgi:hypothetical protein
MSDHPDGDTDADLGPFLDLITDRSIWADPPAGLADRVSSAIAAETAQFTARPFGGSRPASSRWFHLGGALVAGAAAALLAVVAVTLLRAPDQQEVALKGAGAASDVDGTVDVQVVDSGVRLHLRAEGLSRRDGGDFYEGWLKNCDGSLLVPIGTFHDLDDAVGWAGVSVAEFPLLTITTESVAGPRDPSQGSSGDVVLTAQVGPDCAGG